MAAENAFRWLDDTKNITKRADLKAKYDAMLGTPEGTLNPKEMIDAIIKIVPSETGKFRNVVPQFVEDMLKQLQTKAWENII